ncbi:hypothetical protein P9B03_04125 [Metasolibacillus meyeri]|uniref:Zinc ribbon domain-containing protein n=1 Tax=Metasolibacillus meyeri TaxID=1071052 RepID=A0AAW9NIT6_9BACL|nr:hypothetical protein [Metasolibacillus meyeri]MEC1177662.1 hypothetical protein [Metasolibacillus meyeri]
METKVCKRCENTKINEGDNFCSHCGMNFKEPKRIYDMRPVVKELLAVLVKHEILIHSLDRVLEQLKDAALTSTRIQEIWANDDYKDYDQL